jgi:hypothetical protein
MSPAGSDVPVLGHQSFGVVKAVGPRVSELAPLDHVVAIIRRAGVSIFYTIRLADFITEEVYYEHGIGRLPTERPLSVRAPWGCWPRWLFHDAAPCCRSPRIPLRQADEQGGRGEVAGR